jgi:hypothetical protein
MGEVLLSGPGFLDAYYHPWRPREEILTDGWFATGDIGELDADGCLFLRGRSKEVISVLGMKFFPQEVEAVLAAHPRVFAACVFAHPDERLGEVPVAHVVPRGAPGPELARELLAHCRAALAGYKVPERIEFVTELRRTASGKLLRRASSGDKEIDDEGVGRAGAGLGPSPCLPVSLSPCLPTTGRRLNVADRVMLAVDQALRRMGYPGFQTQALVYLDGRADARGLRDALARLAAIHPVAASRLVEAPEGPVWQFRPGAVLDLHETDLDAPGADAVLRHAGRLLVQPHDLACDDPIRFHLLHRPGGQDVLLVQYSHALMDNNATPLLLRELARCAAETPTPPEPSRPRPADPLWGHQRRHPRERRRAAVDATRELLRRSLGRGATMLGRPASRPVSSPLGVLTRTLDPDATDALTARARAAGRLPSLSMALLAAVFRAIDRLAPPGARTGFAAGIGIDLGLRGPHGPIFANLMSLLPVRVGPDDVADRGELTRLLSRQLRDGLASDIDLGMLGLITLFARKPHRAAWAAEIGLRHSFSLWYAYFGALDIAAEFFGAPVADVFYVGPCWSPMGVTLLVNQFRGRLRFQATYVPEAVPEELAAAFLDEVLTDLTE